MDAVELHNRTVGNFAQLVGEVGPSQWSAPTPCADWDVRTLVNHVVGEERWTVPLMAGVGAATDAARAAQAAAGEPIVSVHLSYGDEDASEYLRQLSADHLVHGWDLAAAIGAEARMDPDLVGEVAGWFTEREETYRSVGMIGDRLEGFSDPADALLGAFGRDPGWKP